MSSSSTLPVCFLHLAPLFSLESFRLLKSKLKTKQTPLKAFKDTTKKMKLQNPAKPNIFLCLTKCFIYLFFFCEKMSSSSTLPVCFLHLAPLFSLESFRLLKSKLKTKQTPLKAFKDTTKKNEIAKSSKTQYFPMFYQVFHLSFIFLWENEFFLYVARLFPSFGPAFPLKSLGLFKNGSKLRFSPTFPTCFPYFALFSGKCNPNRLKTRDIIEEELCLSFSSALLPKLFRDSSSTLPRLFLDCSSTLPRLFLDCSSTLPRLFLDCSSTLPWLFLDSSSALPRLFLDTSSTLPRLFLGSSSTLPRLFLGSSLTLPRLFLDSSSALPWLFLHPALALPRLSFVSLDVLTCRTEWT